MWFVAAILSAAPLKAQNATTDPKPAGLRLVMHDRPSLRLGKLVRVDMRAKLQTDFRKLPAELKTGQDVFDLSRLRIGVEGDFLKHFEYQVEREFRESFGARVSKYPWRDVYLNFKYFDNFQLQAGKFKIPFGMEELTSVANLDFVSRSRVADDLAPARDLGVLLHGRFFHRGLSYEAGAFQNDGENSDGHISEADRKERGGRTLALRLSGAPLRPLPLPAQLGRIEVGAAIASSNVPEGLNSLRGHIYSGESFFPRIYVQGRRLRIGTELSWSPGPFSIKGEFIHISEARDRQSIREADLPEKISRGWYVTGTWVITGEMKEGGVEPRRPFLSGGLGAIELAGRYEQLRFGSSEHIVLPSASPRAPNIMGNSDRAWTIGTNWYLNRYARIQANGIRETIEDLQRVPVLNHDRFWTGILRLQFSM